MLLINAFYATRHLLLHNAPDGLDSCHVNPIYLSERHTLSSVTKLIRFYAYIRLLYLRL